MMLGPVFVATSTPVARGVQALPERGHVVEDGDHAGLADQPGAVRAARLQQDDAGARFGEPPGQDAAGAAGSGHDVVSTLFHPALRQNSNTF